MTLEHIPQKSKGSGGWFRPARVEVTPIAAPAAETSVAIEVWGLRQKAPAINLHMSRQDAQTLAGALIAVSTADAGGGGPEMLELFAVVARQAQAAGFARRDLADYLVKIFNRGKQ